MNPRIDKWITAVRRQWPETPVQVIEIRSSAAPAIGPETFASVTGSIRRRERTVLIISDQTRKTGLDSALPAFLEQWESTGLELEDLEFLVACGSHRAPTEEELQGIFGKIAWERVAGTCRVRVHDAFSTPCRRLGQTRRGTPIEIAEIAVQADAVVVWGAAAFHYFAGFSGGPKSIVPGIASRDTIAANHSLSLDPEHGGFARGVRAGTTRGNPVWEDLAEAAAVLPVRAAIQTVMRPDGAIAALFCGEPVPAHRAACHKARELFSFQLGAAADLVIADVEGAPNWLQSHKALVNAERALSPRGVVVLNAPCPEGLGSVSLRRWLEVGEANGISAIMRGLAAAPDINGQTAVSTRLRAPRAVAVTRLEPALIQLLGVAPAENLDQALVRARERLERAGIHQPRVLLMPAARHTVPEIGRGPGAT